MDDTSKCDNCKYKRDAASSGEEGERFVPGFWTFLLSVFALGLISDGWTDYLRIQELKAVNQSKETRSELETKRREMIARELSLPAQERTATYPDENTN